MAGRCVSRVGLFFLFLLCSCTEPGETTGMAASAGGVIGAGLGAIIGNQTGSAGSGLAVGAVAGAATGALIGNALEEQQKALAGYDERLQRQNQVISSQSSQLREIKRVDLDYPASGQDRAVGGALSPVSSQAQGNTLQAQLPPQVGGHSNATHFGSSGEQLGGTVDQNSVRAAHDWGSSSSFSGRLGATAGVSHDSTECNNAREEVQRAKLLDDPADKLFHYRRAMRLCPGVAEFHNELGELYLSLDRSGDAKYEFDQALQIDPTFQPAQRNLASLANR